MYDWHDDLETVGAELFQRYRKRFLQPGILGAIRRDYPGLGWLDLWVRVRSARRILHEGGDFAALQAIRSGRWQRCLAARRTARAAADRRQDRWSRHLVRLGGLLFLSFCLLWSAAAGPWPLLLLGSGWVVIRRRQGPADRPGWGERSAAAGG